MKELNILEWFDSPQDKWYMKYSTKNIVYKFPREVLQDLRLRITRNQKIMEKSQK